MVIALISPLLCKLAVAVATLLPVVGLLIVIVGTPKYLCFASITATLETTPVVSCGNANVISCGSCTTFARLSFNSMLWLFATSPKSPTFNAHSSYTFISP